MAKASGGVLPPQADGTVALPRGGAPKKEGLGSEGLGKPQGFFNTHLKTDSPLKKNGDPYDEGSFKDSFQGVLHLQERCSSQVKQPARTACLPPISARA